MGAPEVVEVEESELLEDEDVILHLARTNDHQYNEDKLEEELVELLEVIAKRRTKGREGTEKALTDELGDVQLRLFILFLQMFGEDFMDEETDPIKERMEMKLKKYRRYIKENLYTGRI